MDSGEEKTQSLLDYAQILWKRRVIILVLFLLASLSTLFYVMRTRPIYEAYTTIRLENVGAQGTLLSDLAALRRGNPIETEIEVIRSRSLAEKVVTALNLNFGTTGQSKDFSGKLEEIILTRDFPYGDYVIEIVSKAGAFKLRGLNGTTIGSGKVGETFATDGLSFRLNSSSFSPGDSLFFRVADPVSAARRIQGSTTVRPVKGANIIRISARDTSPTLAARIANELANQFLKQNLAYARGEARSAKEFIQEQLAVAADTLRDAEQKLKEYKEKARFVLLDENAKENISTLARFEAVREEAKMKKIEVERRLLLLRAQLAGKGAFADYKIVAASPIVTGNPVISKLKGNLSNLEIRRAQLLEEYTALHPDVIEIEGEIEKVKEELNKSIRQVLETGPSASDPVYQSIISGIINAEVEVGAIEDRIAALGEVVEVYNSKLEDLPEKEITLARLTRRREVREKIYTMLLTKLEEARISEAMKVGNTRIVDGAIRPDRPILPKKKRTTFLGAVGGLIIGIGLALFLEYLDTSVKTGEDIERDLRLPFLGAVPSVRNDHGGALEGDEEVLKRVLISRFDPRSPIAEAYRTVRTNLQYVQLDKKYRTIMFTSPLPEEGKSTSLANISLTLSQLGAKTLVVDSDLRRPVQHRIFGVHKSPGLTGILVNEESPDEVISPTKYENLYVLPSGPIPPNPSELLSSDRMKQLITQLKEEFEFILFDSPPILVVTDAAVLGGKTDGTVVVVRFEKTDRRAALEAKKLLENAKVEVLGVVLNDVKIERALGGYGYHYYCRSYYPPYYGDDKGEKVKKKRKRVSSRKRTALSGVTSGLRSVLRSSRWRQGRRKRIS
ncbi:polysaccharide biosynthesis tyrosine autokinase [candidate division TA06 bacterium]|uniref:non-specific protein-tyrosine kinase n=1 Tax=candidate division TA06 bacterium TaxID=2250710 RepID=A0A523UVV6_UNCT6|nr:MAG: polysaccharide biosynthesis tyrosine autokinase [candidate division TA06 bacterium]